MPVTAVRDEGALRMWVCRLPVHIGPLGSCDFAEDHRKNGAFCRGDVGIDPDNQPCGHLRIRRRFLKKALHPAGGQSRLPLRTDLLQNRPFNETTAAPGVNRERLVLCLYRSVTPRSFLSFSRTAFVTPVVSSSVSVRSSARSSRLNATLFLPGAMPGPR